MWVVHVDQEWAASAQQLGLALCTPQRGSQRSDDFDAMVEALAPAAATNTPPDTAQWMAGRHRGHDVLVTIVATTHHDHDHHSHTSYATYAMARIDPPLLVGLKFDSRSPVSLGDLFSFSPIPDRGPQIAALDGVRARQLLEPRDADGFQPIAYARSLKAHHLTVELTDNVVTVFAHDRVTSLPLLSTCLDGAVFLAQHLGGRRQSLAFSPYPEWPALAAEVGLTFDPLRHTLSGTYRDVAVLVALATDQGVPFTQLRAFFPRPLGLGLSLRRQGTVDSIVKFFGGQDIELGDAVFDAAFVVQGRPEDAVRRLLWEPSARAQLVGILGRATRLVIGDRALDVRASGFQTSAATLRAMLDDATAAMRAMLAHVAA